MKNTLSFLIFIFMGILLGIILTEAGNAFPVLNFLTIGKTIGVGYPQPIDIDFSIIKLTLGFSMNMNVATVISLVFSLILYKKIGK